VGATGAALAFAVPASPSIVHAPAITPTRASFAIPSGSTSTWTLRLWSHGLLEGSDNATSGTLAVAVPVTSDCFFQADVSVASPGGQSYFYSGARATVPDCGPPATVAGDIDLCTTTGSPTSTEVGSGTLTITGLQTVGPQSNPVAPTPVPSGLYTMTAGAPSGYVFVVCGGPATVDASGVTASQSVVVPAHGAGAGAFYVVPVAPTGSLNGGGNPGPGAGNAPLAGGGPASSPGNPEPTLAHHGRPAVTAVPSSGLAFTGTDAGPLFVVALLALASGALALALSRLRRRTRRPAHARR
jgi:hypothetical protein